MNGPAKSTMTKSVSDNVIRQGFRAWEKVTNLNFIEVRKGRADIELSFENADHESIEFHGDSRFEDEIAHAFFPPPFNLRFSGQIHFHNGYTWTNSSFNNSTLKGLSICNLSARKWNESVYYKNGSYFAAS